MTGDELEATLVDLSHLLAEHVRVSTELLKRFDAKLKEIELEVAALKFSMDLGGEE